MKGVILAGGFGKRLKPLTDYLPKSLIPVNNTPIIDWQIKYFQKFGVDDIIICLGNHSDQIIKYIDDRTYDAKIQYSVEKKSLGTAGAIQKASNLINTESFFVMNGDIITNLDLNKMHGNGNCIAVIPLRTTFGIVELAGHKIKQFQEKPELENYWMNSGIYKLEKKILKNMLKKGSLEKSTFPVLAKSNNLSCVKYSKVFWKSIDSYKDVEECTDLIKKHNYAKYLEMV